MKHYTYLAWNASSDGEKRKMDGKKDSSESYRGELKGDEHTEEQNTKQ